MRASPSPHYYHAEQEFELWPGCTIMSARGGCALSVEDLDRDPGPRDLHLAQSCHGHAMVDSLGSQARVGLKGSWGLSPIW